jgi:hypothetical protein
VEEVEVQNLLLEGYSCLERSVETFSVLDFPIMSSFLLQLFGAVPGLKAMLNAGGSSRRTVNENSKDVGYDPRKREPEFAHASTSPLWELVCPASSYVRQSLLNRVLIQIPLLGHYHPAISLHARQLMSGQPLTASADLSLTTLSHFLDRFVYKNPKKVKPNQKGKGGSAMQPAASTSDGTNVKLMKGKVGSSEAAVNEEEFLRKKAGDVPVDLVCLFVCQSYEEPDSLRNWHVNSFSFTSFSPLKERKRRPSQRR